MNNVSLFDAMRAKLASSETLPLATDATLPSNDDASGSAETVSPLYTPLNPHNTYITISCTVN